MALIYNHPVYGLATDPDVYYGSNKVRGLYYGTKLVYPSPMSYSTLFNFGQTTSTRLDTASGGVFTNVDDSAEMRVDTDNVVRPKAGFDDGTYTPYAYLTQPFNKYEISASVTLVDDPSNDLSGIVLGKPMSGQNFTTLEFKNGFCWILNGNGRIGRSGYNITSKVAPVKGDVVTFSREWSGLDTRYRVLINGVEKANVIGITVPTDEANRNVAGLFIQYRRQSWSNYYGARITGFEAHTF